MSFPFGNVSQNATGRKSASGAGAERLVQDLWTHTALSCTESLLPLVPLSGPFSAHSSPLLPRVQITSVLQASSQSQIFLIPETASPMLYTHVVLYSFWSAWADGTLLIWLNAICLYSLYPFAFCHPGLNSPSPQWDLKLLCLPCMLKRTLFHPQAPWSCCLNLGSGWGE